MPPPYPIAHPYLYETPTFPVNVGRPSMDRNGKARVGDTVRVIPKPHEFVITAMNDDYLYENTGPGGGQRIYSRKDNEVILVKRGDDPANDPINTIRERTDGGQGVWLKTGNDGWKVLGGKSPHPLKDYFSSDQIIQRMDTNGGLCTPCVGKVVGTLASRTDV